MTKEEWLELAGFRWDKQPELRAEFNNDREAYLAYTAANHDGLVKIYGKQGVKKFDLDGMRSAYLAESNMAEQDDAAARREWDSDAATREEFSGDFEVFKAWRQAVAAGKVRYSCI